MPEENVVVAVRVRPFNSRETTRNAQLVVAMCGQHTMIKDPNNASADPKKFIFDYSYWSHDGYTEGTDGYFSPKDSKYADQKKIFNDLGRGVLDNAWKGYNCSLFAYGQTGSGKSYSIVGFGGNKGIVPSICEELFTGINDKRQAAKNEDDFQVSISILEIYKERVRDLLAKKTKEVAGLKVRQSPTKGFYVDKLTVTSVSTYAQINNKVLEGTKNRTVASTDMNAKSSRAHTIVAINFIQKHKDENGKHITKSSIINLVDLAGSERVKKSGAAGERLEEAKHINVSLSNLGHCIRALTEIARGQKNIAVPFRDSVLTMLLKNALGGNSKTIMIAALSPADINYDETLSTLRFAERTKTIKTLAVVNESDTDKLVSQLKEENKRLMEKLQNSGQDSSNKEIEELKKKLKEQMDANQRELEEMKKSWEDRLKESQAVLSAELEAEKKNAEERKIIPHFWNLSEDSALTGMIIHFCREGTSKIGNKNAKAAPEILMNGLSIQKEHAIVTNKKGAVSVKPLSNAKILVNGKTINKEQDLHHNDRVQFGPNHLYVFHHPQDYAQLVKSGKKVNQPTYDSAQEELAKESGLMDNSKKSREDLILQEDLIQLLPMVREANAMSEELDRKVNFEVCLVSPQARGLQEGLTEIIIKMRNMENGNWWFLKHNDFINRKYLMQDMYQSYVEGDTNWNVSKEKDPFWESHTTPVLIGTAHIYLMSIAHLVSVDESMIIMDFKGNETGNLQMELIPCDSSWSALTDDIFVDDPKELVGKPLYFKFKIKGAKGIPANFAITNCSYKFYLEDKPTITEEIKGTINPDYKHERQISFRSVTNELINYLNNDTVRVEVWGQHKEGGMRSRTKNSSRATANDVGKKSNNSPTSNGAVSRQSLSDDRSSDLVSQIQDNIMDAKKIGLDNVPIEEIEKRLELMKSPDASGGKNTSQDKSKACSLQ